MSCFLCPCPRASTSEAGVVEAHATVLNEIELLLSKHGAMLRSQRSLSVTNVLTDESPSRSKYLCYVFS